MEHLTELEQQQEYVQAYKIISKTGIDERIFKNDGTWTAEQVSLKSKYENKLYMPILIKFFHNFEMKYRRLPSQHEYRKAYLKYSFRHLKHVSWYDDKHKEFIANCIVWRADRAYKSYIIEVMTSKQLELLGYQVFRHNLIDTVMGVDLIAVKDGKYWCLHITKDSSYSRQKLLLKGVYKDWIVNHKTVMYQRNFIGHTKLLYDCTSSEKNGVIGGLPIFKNEYLVERLDDEHSFDWDSEDNQLQIFAQALKYSDRNAIFEFASTDNKLVVR